MEDESNKPILKVGDKVRIKSKEWFDSQYKSNREDIEPPEEYNRPFFDFMEQYCGNICTIKNVYINTIKFNENDEDWESWMFDLIEDSGETIEYKEGDEVQINSKEWYSENRDSDGRIKKNDCIFIEGMARHCGKTFTIESVHKDSKGHTYYYLKENSCAWQSWMFVPTFEVEKRKELEEHVDKKSELIEYQIGDVIIPPSGEEAIIISNSLSGYYDIMYTSNYEAGYLDKTDSETALLEAGKYKDLINTKLSPDAIIRSLRNRFGIIAKSRSLSKEVEDMPKDSNSQSNSSEFDLTKVIYKSKRIY